MAPQGMSHCLWVSPHISGGSGWLLCLQKKEDARRRAEEERERMKQVLGFAVLGGTHTRDAHATRVSVPSSLLFALCAAGWGTHGCRGGWHCGEWLHPCVVAAGADKEGGGGRHPPGDPG